VSTTPANLPKGVGALLDAQAPGARARLADIVRAALGAPAAELLAWEHAALPAGYGPATAGTFRVTGTARVAGATVPWAAVLKILRVPEPEGGSAGGEPGDASRWDHWQREALVYASGVAAGVPGGFGPARCLRVDAGEREERRQWRPRRVARPPDRAAPVAVAHAHHAAPGRARGGPRPRRRRAR
jgi:hypothetical protein